MANLAEKKSTFLAVLFTSILEVYKILVNGKSGRKEIDFFFARFVY